jgi:hypothetical protein
MRAFVEEKANLVPVGRVLPIAFREGFRQLVKGEFQESPAKLPLLEKSPSGMSDNPCHPLLLMIHNGRMCQKLSTMSALGFDAVRKSALLKIRKKRGWFGKFGSGSERKGSGLNFTCASLEKMIQPVSLYRKASVLCPRRGKNCTTKMIKSKNRLPIDERERRNGVVSSGVSRFLEMLKRGIQQLYMVQCANSKR